MRHGGWQRTGIVASVVWMLGAAIYQRNADIRYAWSAWEGEHKTCVEMKANRQSFDLKECIESGTASWNNWLEGRWTRVALIAVAPIPFYWLAVYSFIGIFRWIKRGFSHGEP